MRNRKARVDDPTYGGAVAMDALCDKCAMNPAGRSGFCAGCLEAILNRWDCDPGDCNDATVTAIGGDRTLGARRDG